MRAQVPWRGACIHETAPPDHGHVGTQTHCCQNVPFFKRSSKVQIFLWDLVFEDHFSLCAPKTHRNNYGGWWDNGGQGLIRNGLKSCPVLFKLDQLLKMADFSFIIFKLGNTNLPHRIFVRRKCKIAYSKLPANDRFIIFSEILHEGREMRADSQEISGICPSRDGLEGFLAILGRRSKDMETGNRQKILSWKRNVTWFGWNKEYMTVQKEQISECWTVTQALELLECQPREGWTLCYGKWENNKVFEQGVKIRPELFFMMHHPTNIYWGHYIWSWGCHSDHNKQTRSLLHETYVLEVWGSRCVLDCNSLGD